MLFCSLVSTLFLRALTAKSQILNFYIDLLTEAFNNSLKMANSARPNLLRCSKCNTFRDENSFEKHRSGKVKKLCNRHGRKRKLDAVFNSWDAFEDRLVAWNRPVWLFFWCSLSTLSTIMSVHLLTFSLSQDQTKPLELNLTFDLDRLPVAFGTALSMKDGNLDRKPLNDT